jgi:hypothetical protein
MLSSLLLLFLVSPTLSVLVNRTIDDALPDAFGNKVQYSPNTGGRAWNVGGDCDACSASGLDVSQLFDKTWHDGTVSYQRNAYLFSRFHQPCFFFGLV